MGAQFLPLIPSSQDLSGEADAISEKERDSTTLDELKRIGDQAP